MKSRPPRFEGAVLCWVGIHTFLFRQESMQRSRLGAFLLRYPVCALAAVRLRCTPTAATRSGRFIRPRRRSHRSPSPKTLSRRAFSGEDRMFRFRRGEWRANTVRPYEKVSYICVILSKRSASKNLRTIDRPVDPSIRLRLTQDDKILEAVRCREGIAGREKCGKNVGKMTFFPWRGGGSPWGARDLAIS